jgi:hypothetical protein
MEQMSTMKRVTVDCVTISSQFYAREFGIEGQAKEEDLSRGGINSFGIVFEKIYRTFRDFLK